MVVNDVEVITRVSAGVACAPAAATNRGRCSRTCDLALRCPGAGQGKCCRLPEVAAGGCGAQTPGGERGHHSGACRGVPFRLSTVWRSSRITVGHGGLDALGCRCGSRPSACVYPRGRIHRGTHQHVALVAADGLGRLARWRRLVPQLSLTVNMHADALLDADWKPGWWAACRMPWCRPLSLILEISERALVPEQARRQLESLRSRGVDIWIDDFWNWLVQPRPGNGSRLPG